MSKLSSVASGFAGQIATAVWIGKLTDEAAREALGSYALACHRAQRMHCAQLRQALLAEYRHRRALQDVCS